MINGLTSEFRKARSPKVVPKAFSLSFVCNPFNISADLVVIGVDATTPELAVPPGIALAIKEEAVVARR